MKIIIDGVEVDLNRIGINFTPNDEQVAALNHLAKFMYTDDLTTVLDGSAGTGKSSIMRIFLEYVRIKHRFKIKLVAPTHKAKAVLTRLANNGPATTLHKLLGLKPNFNILEFDAKDMKFLNSLTENIFEYPNELIIVDEYSMINDDLYDMLVTKMKGGRKCKMIFLGDIRQIAGVKQSGVSKIPTSTDYPGFTLNKVERQQDNPLLDTLVTLRETEQVEFKTKVKDGKGIVVHNMASFKEALSETFFSLETLNGTLQGSKILAYTNDRVMAYNRFARNLMGCDKKAINVGENILGYDSYSSGFDEILHNGSEYVVTYVKPYEKQIPHFGKFKGYLIVLNDIHLAEDFEVFLLDPDETSAKYKQLGVAIEDLRLSAVNARKAAARFHWKKFYEINEAFITMHDIHYDGRTIRKKTIDYGYAQTAHKSQASSYTNVFVDIPNIQICRHAEGRRQLQYVALSRPTHLAHVLIK